MKVSYLSLAFWILVGVLIPKAQVSALSSTNDQDINQMISEMTTEQKAGQFLMLGVSEDTLNPSLQKFLKKINPGFIVLFKRNIKTPLQTSKLTFDIHKFLFQKNKISPAFAIDQEGGDVVRIPTNPPIPTALAMGKSQDEKAISSIGQEIGKSLKLLGISINLAPVLDIASPEQNSFIQTRSFGNTSEMVSMMAKQFAIGLNRANVAATAKHFPGLGSSEKDTHKSAVISKFTKDEIKDFLKPYRDLIHKNNVQAIMLTHLIYPNLDAENKPATFSPAISNLAREIGFNGIIMTDDVEMGGAKLFKTPERRAIEAFKAGSDVIMVAWNKISQKKAHQGLAQALVSGEISSERAHESLVRILKLKKQLGLLDSPQKSNSETILAQIKSELLSKSVDQIFEKVFKKEVKKLSSSIEDLDLSRVAVVSNDYSVYKNLKKEFSSRLKFFWSTDTNINSRVLSPYSLVIFHSLGPKTTSILKSLDKKIKAKTLVLNSSYPGNLNESEYFEILQLSMKHPQLGTYLGKWFSEQESSRLPTSDYVKK